MLAPNARELLLDALRPDPGFTLDVAVGTTFSLDLDALLMAPLSFALFDVDEGSAQADVMALFAAVKSYAAKMAIYTDAAHVHVPAKGQPLLQMLESSILPVSLPDGAFHPKVWVLRFRSPDGEPRHRVLVLSRNLTFDRSWDTVLRLDEAEDGEATNNAIELAEFLQELDRLSPSPLVTSMLASVAGVSFAPPAGFDDVRFWPLFGDRPDPMEAIEAQAALVISPFATAGRLAKLAPAASRRAFVTRPDTLDRLGAQALERWHDVFVLHSEAVEDPDGEVSALSGLHAKVHVFDEGKTRRIFTGSANATTAAFGKNVELIVEMTSQQAGTRVERLLAETAGEPTLRALLVPRRPVNPEPAPKTPEDLEAERLDDLARRLASGSATARAVQSADGSWWAHLDLPVPEDAVLAPSDRLRARLVTAGRLWQTVKCVGGAARASLPAGSTSHLTSLIALELRGDPQLDVAPRTLVVLASLLDAPEDREQQLLLDLVPNAEKLLRLLFMLLADGREGADAAASVRQIIAAASAGDHNGWVPQLPLFENLVRTFGREPHRLGAVRSVIDQLRSTPEGSERFPDGFLTLWATFEAALSTKDKA